jgi:hypothetical protein
MQQCDATDDTVRSRAQCLIAPRQMLRKEVKIVTRSRRTLRAAPREFSSTRRQAEKTCPETLRASVPILVTTPRATPPGARRTGATDLPLAGSSEHCHPLSNPTRKSKRMSYRGQDEDVGRDLDVYGDGDEATWQRNSGRDPALEYYEEDDTPTLPWAGRAN